MKGIAILLIIIVILGGVLAFKIMSPNNATDISENIKQMSKQEVLQLVEKGLSNDNYILKYNDDEGKETVKKVKGDIITVKTADMYMWQKLTTNEQISINYDRKVALVSKKGTLFGSLLSKSYGGISTELFTNPKYEFAYIEENTHKGNKCIVIQFKWKEEKSYEAISKSWIDINTGIVVKTEAERLSEDGNKELVTRETDIQLNVVTDEEMKKPDLSGYQVTDMDTI